MTKWILPLACDMNFSLRQTESRTLAPISNIESLDFCAISVVSLYCVPSSLPVNTQ
jgi:hypothetical protein